MVDSNATQALSYTALIVGLASILTWAEFTYLGSWKRATRPPSHGRLIFLRVEPRIALLAASLLLVFHWQPLIRSASLLVLSHQVMSFAATVDFGREGSDEMALVVVLPLTLAALPAATPTIQSIALLFIGGQLALAYGVSASAKLLGSKWRIGTAVPQILSTADYGLGVPQLRNDTRLIFRALTWATILVEFAIPVFLVLGGRLTLPALALGLLLHLSVAFMMGLNRFLPWFLSAYPAAYWSSQHYGVLSGHYS